METVKGTLRVMRHVKHDPELRTERGIDKAIRKTLWRKLHGIPPPEYPPTYRIETGTEVTIPFNGVQKTFKFTYQFKGQPKALDKTMDGWKITVKGIPEPFPNPLGAYITRYKILSVIPPPGSPAGDFAKFLVGNSESTGVPGLFELKPKENASEAINVEDPER